MSWFTKALSGSIGRKLIMAASGLFLVTFLLEHLIGNLLLLNDDKTVYNGYAKFMGENIVISILEYVLFAGFIIHIVFAIIITIQNKKVRPVGYAVSNASENSSWFSRNMGLTGLTIFAFLALHLKTFFLPHKVGIGQKNAETLWDEAVYTFSSPVYVGIYVVAMTLLAFHLVHGFQSSFQTLGARHPKYTPLIKGTGYGFAIIVPALFALIPVYMYLHHTLNLF